jgi:hypothetical protein
VNSSELGNVGEKAFLYRCSKLSINVCSPENDFSPYDFIVDVNGKFLKIQVKSTATKDKERNKYIVHLRRGSTNSYKYKKSEVDFYAIYLINEDQFYIMPFSKVGKVTISSKVHKYLEAFHLLK